MEPTGFRWVNASDETGCSTRARVATLDVVNPLHPLTTQAALEMARFAKRVADGSKKASEFFLYWPDLASDENKIIVDLWFHVQYLEIDSELKNPDPVTLDLHRDRIVELAAELERRFAQGGGNE